MSRSPVDKPSLQIRCFCKKQRPWNTFTLKKLIVTHLVETFIAINGTIRSITVPATARHWSLCVAKRIQPTTTPFQINFNIILPSKPMSSKKSPLPCYTSAHLILPDLVILTIFSEEYILWSSSLCNLLQPRVASCHLGPALLLSTLSNERCPYSTKTVAVVSTSEYFLMFFKLYGTTHDKPYRFAWTVLMASWYESQENYTFKYSGEYSSYQVIFEVLGGRKGSAKHEPDIG
jgi:hypothetical protein